ncbi:hypothetical protein ACFSJY_13275 [Thalassotalea euphylliae]|uniref:hypothetical protein n=1 Tax=Thalassotalea euphylliae TaxID=1655234 RepID=UPI003628F470
MRLSHHISQGRLLYFTHDQDAISVYQNEHFRWLTIGDVVQSAMHRRLPHRLTLPHQWAMMLPLLYSTPRSIIEFGLGGGNHRRFIHALYPDIDYRVIEYNQSIINACAHYFELSKHVHEISHNSVENWLSTTAKKVADWYIYDVYQPRRFGEDRFNASLQQLIARLPQQSHLTINLPAPTHKEVDYWLGLIAQKTSHQHFTTAVPQYKNVVIHLIGRSTQGAAEERGKPQRRILQLRRYQSLTKNLVYDV